MSNLTGFLIVDLEGNAHAVCSVCVFNPYESPQRYGSGALIIWLLNGSSVTLAFAPKDDMSILRQALEFIVTRLKNGGAADLREGFVGDGKHGILPKNADEGASA